jgi:hypothetical protein
MPQTESKRSLRRSTRIWTTRSLKGATLCRCPKERRAAQAAGDLFQINPPQIN